MEFEKQIKTDFPEVYDFFKSFKEMPKPADRATLMVDNNYHDYVIGDTFVVKNSTLTCCVNEDGSVCCDSYIEISPLSAIMRYFDCIEHYIECDEDNPNFPSYFVNPKDWSTHFKVDF